MRIRRIKIHSTYATNLQLTRNGDSSAALNQVCHDQLFDSIISVILPVACLYLSDPNPSFFVLFGTSSGCACTHDGGVSLQSESLYCA